MLLHIRQSKLITKPIFLITLVSLLCVNTTSAELYNCNGTYSSSVKAGKNCRLIEANTITTDQGQRVFIGNEMTAQESLAVIANAKHEKLDPKISGELFRTDDTRPLANTAASSSWNSGRALSVPIDRNLNSSSGSCRVRRGF